MRVFGRKHSHYTVVFLKMPILIVAVMVEDEVVSSCLFVLGSGSVEENKLYQTEMLWNHYHS